MPVLSNTVAAVVVPADPTHRHVIDSITWSYSGVPSVGGLQVLDDATVIFDLDITLAGSNTVSFRKGLASVVLGNPVLVNLAAGGLNVTGKLNVEWHDENA